ncbi:MAG: HupE/UreJ family protein [Cyanobacteriota bacterium]|jgi:urease accessory protein
MKFFSSGVLVGSVLLTGALLLLSPAAQAHHVMDLMQLKPTPISGMLSGLLHPVIGPDHLLFLLSLSLVGWQRRWPSMLTLLATGLAGSALGLWLPGLPGAEALVAFSLVLVGLVLLRRLPQAVLFPAFALHGSVLSASVLGWTTMPIASYLLGLLISQAVLLLVALQLLRKGAARLSLQARQLLASGLLGSGAAWAWSAMVG